jgi:UDP-N-acetylmuramoyl-tripeptide--D-alanyl-D-alanine ligase
MRPLYRIWRYYLYFCAKLYLSRTKPLIIIIAGSVGKTTTKDVMFAALSHALYTKRVRCSHGNLNNEIGVPLAILDFNEPVLPKQVPRKFTNILQKSLFLKKTDVLILEYAIDHPRDMDYLCKIAQPDIAVVTPIAEEHLEFLGDLDTVYDEQTKLFKHIRPEGNAIIPYDKRLMKIFIPRRFTYGIEDDADFQLKAAEIKITGTNLNVAMEGQTFTVQSPLLGIEQNFSVLATLAAGFILNTDLSLCIKAISEYLPAPGRLRPIEGRGGITLIDDSYNASPASVTAALKVLSQVAESHRKVAILGTMNELGSFSESAHQSIGKLLPKLADIAILIGPYSDLTKESAIQAGFKKDYIYSFEKPTQARIAIKKIIKKGDFILIKASQNLMRFENITKSLMKNPDRAKKLLVRQESRWSNKS